MRFPAADKGGKSADAPISKPTASLEHVMIEAGWKATPRAACRRGDDILRAEIGDQLGGIAMREVSQQKAFTKPDAGCAMLVAGDARKPALRAAEARHMRRGRLIEEHLRCR